VDNIRSGQEKEWKLRLYVSRYGEDSLGALSRLKSICDEHLSQGYSIELIDIDARPDLMVKDQILLMPTLLRLLPLPERRLSGALDDTELVLAVLGLGPYAI
jgi:circadian clock protein KaiB